MPQHYVVSSALVKRYVLEQGTDRVLELMDAGRRLIVSRLALVEITSASVRRARAGDLSKDAMNSILATLEAEFRARFDVIELRGAVMTRATDLIRSHALRAADAIQLACAVVARGGSEAPILFVSSDRELNEAAKSENFEVIDPTEHA